MSDKPNQMQLEGFLPRKQVVATPLEWLNRSYKSMEHWKATGKDLYFSLNGQSDVTRNRLACLIRTSFVESTLQSEEIARWKRDSMGQETIEVVPPRITASNSSYFDWLYLADYVLLACATDCEEIEVENRKRKDEWSLLITSYETRLSIFRAREILRNTPGINDSDILKALRLENKDGALAHVKEARNLEKNGEQLSRPVKPPTPSLIERYVPFYFK